MRSFYKWVGVNKATSAMNHLIEQQLFALEMDALTYRMQHLQLQDKLITLLNQMLDKVCYSSTVRRIVEVNLEQDGMEVTVGELGVPTFYFYNDKKFWSQLQCVLKTQVQWNNWLKVMIHQQFVIDWMKEPFVPWYWKHNGKPMLKQ